MSGWRRRLLGWLVGGDYLLVSRERQGCWLVNAVLSERSWEEVRDAVTVALEITEPR